MMETKAPLSRDRIIKAAMTVADESGLAGLTMRSLADELQVAPPSVFPIHRWQGGVAGRDG